MKTLILAPFDPESLETLAIDQQFDIVHENWLETGELADPVKLGHRLDQEQFGALVVEGDFLFAETFELASNLVFAGVCRSTVTHIDIDSATKHGVVIANAPARNADAVAELVIGFIFASSRRIVEADRYVNNGSWQSPLDAYTNLRSSEISDKVIGIIGLGAIGR